MLISETHNFLFIAIPKTGTHTVRHLLRPFSDDEQVGTGGGISQHRKSKILPHFHHIPHGHLTAHQILNSPSSARLYTVSEGITSSARLYTVSEGIASSALLYTVSEGIASSSLLYKFATVRNPYDRAVSLWAFWTRNNPKPPNILQFWKRRSHPNKHFLFYPQTHFTHHPETHQLLLDYLIHFENYHHDMVKLIQYLNSTSDPNLTPIPIPNKLPKINSSHHHPWPYYYHLYPTLSPIIQKLYQRDFNLLNYPLEIPPLDSPLPNNKNQ